MKSIETGVWGAYQNVLINLKDVKDDTMREKVASAFNTTVYSELYTPYSEKVGLVCFIFGHNFCKC